MVSQELLEIREILEKNEKSGEERMVWDGLNVVRIPSEQEQFANQLFSPHGLRKLFGLGA